MASRLRVAVLLGVALLGLTAAGLVVADDPQHEHPDDAADDEDLEALQGWLGDQMGSISADCSQGITVGSFDACEDLDEEYESLLERYVEVERETTDEEDQDGKTFNETRDHQQTYAELVAEFYETLDAYEERRAAGDDQRARELARELRELADRIESVGGELAVRFETLDDRTTADLETSGAETRETTNETLVVVTSIERETFEPTETSVNVTGAAAVDDPATVSGRVTDEADQPVTDGTVVLDAGGRQPSTTLDKDGYYEFAYRPTTAPLDRSNVTVRYRPAAASPYLNSNASAPIEIRQHDSHLELSATTESAAFADTVSVSGTVESGDEPAAGVRVVALLDGDRFESTRTDERGRFELSGRLGADVAVGEADLLVRASEPGLAVSPSETETRLSVLETETELDADAVVLNETTVLTGTLTTGDGTALGGRTVTATIDGETLSTTTESDGTYRMTVPSASSERSAVVRYDDAASNLATSETEVLVAGADDDGVAPGADRGLLGSIAALLANRPILSVVSIGGLSVLCALAFRRLRSWRTGGDGVTREPTVQSPDRSATTETSATHSRLLEAAREQIESHPDLAIQSGYAAVRSRFEEPPARTHWEFYRSVREGLSEDRQNALRSLTESFEASAFSSTAVDSERAERAVAAAEQCLSGGDTD